MKKDMPITEQLRFSGNSESVPVKFSFDGVAFDGFSSQRKPNVRVFRPDSCIAVTEISSVVTKGVMARARQTVYGDFPAVKWEADMSNFGKSASPVLSDFAITAELTGTAPVLGYGNGDTRADGLFSRFEENLLNEKTISPSTCRGADGASPFMTLKFSEYSVKLAIGWPGKWKIVFTPLPTGVRFTLSQARCKMKLHADETVRTPNITVLFFEGDDTVGTNLWRRFYFKHILPVGKGGKKIEPKMFLHTHKIGGYGEFEGITTENQLEAIDTFIKKGLKPDGWWIDAGWYPCEHNWWHTGDWTPNPEQLPDGFLPISDELHKNGIELLVWFEPERVYEGSRLDYLHPEWCLVAHNENGEEEKCRLLNYSNPECFDFVLNMLDKHIKDGKIDIYRQDFNFVPDKYFEENEGKDREGALENLHFQALLRLYDELLARNPELVIDNCAAGGTRNEMDLLSRSVPLQYTDMHISEPDKRVFHYYEMFSWMPYFRAHATKEDERFSLKRNLDEYAYLCAMTPAVTFCADWYEGESIYKTARKMLPVWRKAAEYELNGDFYSLTGADSDWYAVQFHNNENNTGFIEVIRTAEAVEANIKIQPFIVPNTKYIFKNPLTGEIKRCDSTGLGGGLTFFNSSGNGEIWFYEARTKDNI